MAAIEKLSPAQWARIRRVWEQDPRKGFSWVLERIPVPVTRAAIRNRAIREGWSKRLEGFPERQKPTAKTYEILSIENHTQGSSRLCDAALGALVRVGTSSAESMTKVLRALSAACVYLEDDEATQLTERFSDVLFTAMHERDEAISVLSQLLEAKA